MISGWEPLLSFAAAWLFLAGSVIGAIFTAHAFLPRKDPRVLILSFAASMLTLELAGQHLLWQLGAAALFIGAGALDHTAGVAALAVSIPSWLGLLAMIAQGRSARGVMHRALDGYVTRWDGPELRAGHFLMPFPLWPAGVRVTRDVVYARLSGRRLKLDVYAPDTPGTGRPAVLQIHGGGWVVGDKREQGVPLCVHMAHAGWVAFNVNYRLSPGATFPDHLVDLKRALAWIREHADDYGIDPSFIAVTGGSAGGHLTAMMALTQNDPRYQPGFESADTSVQAAVPFYGVYDFTNRFGHFPKIFVGRLLQAHVMKARLDEEPEKFRDASPIDIVSDRAPPFLVIHGDRDTLAPLEDAQRFVKALEAVSKQPVLFAEIRGAQHAFDILVSPRSAPIIEAVERFLEETQRRAGEA